MLVQSKPCAHKAHIRAWSVSSRHEWSKSKCAFENISEILQPLPSGKMAWHSNYTIVAIFLLHSACLFAIASLALQGFQFTLVAPCSTSLSFSSTPVCLRWCWHAFAALCWPQYWYKTAASMKGSDPLPLLQHWVGLAFLSMMDACIPKCKDAWISKHDRFLCDRC